MKTLAEGVLSDVSHLEFLISFDFEKTRQPVLRRALAMPKRNSVVERSAGASCPSRNACQIVILLIKKEKRKKGMDWISRASSSFKNKNVSSCTFFFF